jgi:hypothetical protein
MLLFRPSRILLFLSLITSGMTEYYEAQYYQRELDANHVLLLMNADERPEEAFGLFRQQGAFDIHSRLRTLLENGSADMHPGSPPASQRNAPPAAASWPERSQVGSAPERVQEAPESRRDSAI